MAGWCVPDHNEHHWTDPGFTSSHAPQLRPTQTSARALTSWLGTAAAPRFGFGAQSLHRARSLHETGGFRPRLVRRYKGPFAQRRRWCGVARQASRRRPWVRALPDPVTLTPTRRRTNGLDTTLNFDALIMYEQAGCTSCPVHASGLSRVPSKISVTPPSSRSVRSVRWNQACASGILGAIACGAWASGRSKGSIGGMKLADTRGTILVTGAAGFIGFHLCRYLLAEGRRVVGLDELNDYYEVDLKRSRRDLLLAHPAFVFVEGDIGDRGLVESVFQGHSPSHVVHLAAQAGVRYSLENPRAYIHSNIIGFFNVLETCRQYPVDHLLYASSSSVYGGSSKVPFEESDFVNQPLSLYAATKLADEMMAHCYSHLYDIPATGLRFFTVYGPWGRPDMAYFSFVDSHFAKRGITVFNQGGGAGDLWRDFTYVDDVVEGVGRLLSHVPTGAVRHAVYNIGNSDPVSLTDFIATLEKCLGRALGSEVVFEKHYEAMKPGDVPATFASTDLLDAAVGFRPSTPLEVGLQRFADWYVTYRGLVGGDDSAFDLNSP